MLVSREDFARYPFTREASDYVKRLDLKIDELASPDYARIIEKAERRVDEALIYGSIRAAGLTEKEVEILSFPVAVLFVAKIGDNFLKKRYALAEAKRANELLRGEDDIKLVEIAKSTFDWRARTEAGRFFLSLVDYLRNSTDFHDDRWKLINRIVARGEVLLSKDDFARLLQEEIRRRIEGIVENSPKVELAPPLAQKVGRLNQVLIQRKEETRMEELPKTAVSAAYPPCIRRLYDSLLAGQHVSHMGRFTLTSFLLSVGIKADELTKMYTSISDFDEKLTRYQVEHIAGERGSRTKYTPPNCSTLKTHGLCPSPDDLCARIRHPLSYYRRKLIPLKRVPTDRK